MLFAGLRRRLRQFDDVEIDELKQLVCFTTNERFLTAEAYDGVDYGTTGIRAAWRRSGC